MRRRGSGSDAASETMPLPGLEGTLRMKSNHQSQLSNRRNATRKGRKMTPSPMQNLERLAVPYVPL